MVAMSGRSGRPHSAEDPFGVQALTVQDRVRGVHLALIAKPHTHPTEEHTLRHGRRCHRGPAPATV